MVKFILFGGIAYFVIGLIFLRMTVTVMARRKRANPDAKLEYAGCIGCATVFLWPLLPIVQLVIDGVIKENKKLVKEIKAVEDLLKDEQLKVKQYESLIEADPSTKYLFEDDLKESRRKVAKWSEDLKKLKAQYAKASFK
jgi:hypothetical protein